MTSHSEINNPLTPDEAVKPIHCPFCDCLVLHSPPGDIYLHPANGCLLSQKVGGYSAWNTRPSLAAKDAEIERLREALREAIGLIKTWYKMNLKPSDLPDVTWKIYLEQSPEMGRLTSALATPQQESTNHET